ncbi:MAG: hypothetical protein VYA67_22165 [Actinomycetota bacterium]|nr:hypothetical protein [Actinomycetota bacterium]
MQLIQWFCTDWHWALILIALTVLCVFGLVVVVVDDNGDTPTAAKAKSAATETFSSTSPNTGSQRVPRTNSRTGIPADVDAQLAAIAGRPAGQNPGPLLRALGWTRPDYVTAIHNRLRDKHRQSRNEGRQNRDDTGPIRITEAPEC